MVQKQVRLMEYRTQESMGKKCTQKIEFREREKDRGARGRGIRVSVAGMYKGYGIKGVKGRRQRE